MPFGIFEILKYPRYRLLLKTSYWACTTAIFHTAFITPEPYSAVLLQSIVSEDLSTFSSQGVMSWLFQIVFGCQPKSEFLHKTRAGKSQLVCADFDLLKGSRYRLTFSAQYLTSTSLEMGTVSTLINSLKVCLVLLQPLCVSFFVFFPHLKIITVLQCLVNYRGCC